jgi:hypothetical protein
METHGPLGTLWVGFGLIGFYLALIWLNTLLGIFLTPLFLIPGTWLMDFVQRRRGNIREEENNDEPTSRTARDRTRGS